MTNLYKPWLACSKQLDRASLPKNPIRTAPDWLSDAPPGHGFARLDAEKFPDFSNGSVWLVGAGPGAPGLLSLLAYHALQTADVIVYDALVNTDILRWAKPGTGLEYAGKRGGKPSPNQRDISMRLIELARQNKRVLRLKGGDPLIFGRGGEEAGHLAAAGISFRIVPGISAGVGGLAYAGLPATHRDTNHSVIFLTGHDATGTLPANVNWAAVASASPIIVMYMAIKNLRSIAAALIQGGRPADDPVTIISNATMPSQEVWETTLGGVAQWLETHQPPVPAIVVVGKVAQWRALLDWYKGSLLENKVG
jgi:uroporphyrin-III C-methyltransferase